MAIDAAEPATDVSALVRAAIGLLASDPQRAEAMAREILEAAPENLDALIVLGTALRLQGALEPARRVLEPLATAQRASWVVQFEVARVLLALGESRAAAAPLSQAVALNPGLAAGWRLLGDIWMVSGQLPTAQAAYDRHLRSVIRDPRLQAPAEALAEGRLDVAEREVRSVLALEPASATAAHVLGEVLRRRGRLADATALLAQCLDRAPDLDLARESYALALLAIGEPAKALVQLERLLAKAPGDNRCRMMKAAALTEAGDFAAAAQVTASLLEVFPDQPQAWLLYGNGLRTLGRIDEAVAAYGRCIVLDSDCSEAYWSLANLKTYRFSAEACAAMRARLSEPRLGPVDRSNLHFALGKAHEDAKDYAAAFDHYARGNAIQRELRGYDPARTTGFVQRSKALFTPAFFAERAGWGSAAADPIFIVGLPRSGSTLIDQILASHPSVEGTRELHDLQVIADWIELQRGAEQSFGYPDQVEALPRDLCAKFGRDYLKWTSAQRKSDRPRFTDKAPWNFLHTGLIHLILPKAKIIDIRRHPLGCCLSAFKQHFASGFDFSNDLTDLGRYYADYVDLMAHFDQVLPGRIHRVIYEDLVENTEAEVRRLLAYLDLPFDPACLRFFENPRAVATPSSEQVRRPIFADAVDQWRHFEPWLAPLKDALGPVLAGYPRPPT
ncbi:MAG TPA: sulfotransferase [Caulobacteraceae bacterium]|jgi:tetratricopeptide (TPR) repeat protein